MSIKKYIVFFILFFFAKTVFAQVAVGTSNPSAAAMLEVSSQNNGLGNYMGFMFPRVPNIAARNAITVSPSDQGLLVYVVEEECLQMFNGIKWINVTCESSIAVGSSTQNFETTPAVPNLAIFDETGSGYYTTGLGDFPNTALYVSGERGYGVSNGSSALTLGPVNVSGSTDATFKLRLAGFALTNASNGMDVTDTVKISISTTGTGGTFSEELLILGGAANDSNNTWGFDATRTATVVYDGDGTPTSFTSGTGNDGTTGGISFLEITGIPNSANLAVKIVLLNNKSNEQWVIDDAEIIGN